MKIGKIIAINYSEMRVRISTEIRGNSVNIDGEIYYFGNIGGYLKTTNAIQESIVCEVSSILDSDPDKETQSFNLESDRELILKPIGTLSQSKKNVSFNLGVGIYPSLYSDVSILTFKDMQNILSLSGAEEEDKQSKVVHRNFLIGVSKSLINYPINIDIDKFFQIHSAILGNSGSGKSNTISHILQQVLSKENYFALGAKIILFDTNGEYQAAFSNLNKDDLEVINYKPISSTDTQQSNSKGTREILPFHLPHFLLTLDEWGGFLLATEATQKPFLRKILQESHRFMKLANGDIDGEHNTDIVHYFVYRICSFVTNVVGRVDSDVAKITSVISLIHSMTDIITSDRRFNNAKERLFSKNTSQTIDYTTVTGSNTINPINIQQILIALQNACDMSYSNNQDSLGTLVTKIQTYIDQDAVHRIQATKYIEGAYFDIDFLRLAAEMALLEEDSVGNKNIRNWTSTMITRMDYFLDNADCQFMRDSCSNIKDTESYLQQYFGLADKNQTIKQLIIIDTSELPLDVLETITSVTTRLLFDYRRKTTNRAEHPIHLVLDEAHRYIKKDTSYLLKENIFEKVAREGRKFSFFLLISSQRPSELSETVLSQCGNYIVHRIQNDADMRYISAMMPFFTADIGSKIRQATAGDMMIFGHCVPMPLQIKVDLANPAPNSKNCDVSEQWYTDLACKSLLDKTLDMLKNANFWKGDFDKTTLAMIMNKTLNELSKAKVGGGINKS